MKKEYVFFSETLKSNTSVSIITPDLIERKSMKILWLLHGGYGDNNEWIANTDIAKLAEERNLCVIMPSAGNSFYSDMTDGGKYFTHLTEELPKLIKAETAIDVLSSGNYIAGVSMGGYGAFKIALNYPEKFKYAAALSGSIDLKAMYDYAVINDVPTADHFNKVYGSIENFLESRSDLFSLILKRKAENKLPKLYMCCGTNDFLFHLSKSYVEHLNNNMIDVTYEEDEGFSHDYSYWNTKLESVLGWMGV